MSGGNPQLHRDIGKRFRIKYIIRSAEGKAGLVATAVNKQRFQSIVLCDLSDEENLGVMFMCIKVFLNGMWYLYN